MRMKRIWAPWRFEYLGSAQTGCFFCQSLEAGDPAKVLLLARNRHALMIMNRYPYNSGHVMIATRRHIGHYDKLRASEIKALDDLLIRAIKALKLALKPQGFNIGINQGAVAGAGVIDHIHIHCVPRWTGDTNYMPVIGDTKVVSDSLENTYTMLIQALKKI